MKKLLKGGVIGLSAIVLSTLGIFASDTLQGIAPRINLGSVGSSMGCGAGTVPFVFQGRTLCVDIYEASPGDACPHLEPGSALETERNVNAKGCVPISTEEAIPWTHVSLPQAERLCSSVGKRLPTSDEWYAIALGTSPEECTITGSEARKTGTGSCVSGVGAYDLVGNVWEWVDETVVNGTFDDRPLPSSGYVTSVDGNGVAITAGDTEDELYGKDYIWTKAEDVLGMIRGGFYGSGEDAGLYTINASIATSFATQGIGFRCVQDLI